MCRERKTQREREESVASPRSCQAETTLTTESRGSRQMRRREGVRVRGYGSLSFDVIRLFLFSSKPSADLPLSRADLRRVGPRWA